MWAALEVTMACVRIAGVAAIDQSMSGSSRSSRRGGSSVGGKSIDGEPGPRHELSGPWLRIDNQSRVPHPRALRYPCQRTLGNW